MLGTNLKILAVVLVTVGFYTLLANAIPQVESEVPETLTFSGEVTPAALVAAGEELYQGAGGCTACHGLGTRAPNLLTDEGGAGTIGARCGSRVAGMSCKAYLHQSLVDPTAHVVEGYQPIMPEMDRVLSPTQIWALVAYLESVGGEVTVTAEDVAAASESAGAAGAGAGGGAAGGAAPSASASLDPMTIVGEHQCRACHRIGGEGGAIGPVLDGIGARHDVAYIRRSILEPNADTAAGYEAVAGTMPPNFGQQLTAAQLEALVRYLAESK
ncbi:MAG TPA: c-type cytochrome [Longimicrobiales bacterium]